MAKATEQIVLHPSWDSFYFDLQKPKDKKGLLLSAVTDNAPAAALVFCVIPAVANDLVTLLKKNNITAFLYDNELSEEERAKNLASFSNTEGAVLVCTATPDTKPGSLFATLVVHFNMPVSIERYCEQLALLEKQEEPIRSLVLYGSKDIITARVSLDIARKGLSFSTEELELVKQTESDRVKAMIQYCHASGCLREYLANYFSEKPNLFCGQCSNCDKNFEEINITDHARIILTCVFRLGTPYNTTMIIDILRGIHSERVRARHFYHMPVFGLLKELSEARLQEMIAFLVSEGYLTLTDDPPTLALTTKASGVLQADDVIVMQAHKEAPLNKLPPQRVSKQVDKELLQKLKKQRSALARSSSVPPYVILTDATLQEMAQFLPKSREKLRKITGFTEAKIKQFGTTFLDIIQEHSHE